MASWREIIWYQILGRLPEIKVRSKTKHGVMYFSNQDQVIGRKLFTEKAFDFDKMVAVKNLLTDLKIGHGQDSLLLDIGANIGTVCIPLVKDRFFSKALAFEPESKNFSFLKKNVTVNGLQDQITCFQMALSSKTGIANLMLSTNNFGDHRLQTSSSEKTQLEEHSVSVEMKKLDDVLLQNQILREKIKLIWMDVQGHEKHVLEGSTQLLELGIPLVMEFWPFGLNQAKVDENEYANLLKKYFKYFYDLSLSQPARQSIEQFKELYQKYPGETFTDLLLISQ